ncbi:hypothetical protein AOA12_16585 [Microbacterium sp. No. 7]|nr:hypothetical protein AOA12_16585 [Microbacterium sp. No. 7]
MGGVTLRRLLAPHRRQRGEMDMSAETAVLALGVIVLLGFTISFGWVAHADTSLHAAAATAAREISLLRDAATADTAAATAARRAVEAQGVSCQHLTVIVDSSGLDAPLGEIGIVRVTITCTIALVDLPFAGTPLTTSLTATGINPVDRYRERS